MISPPFVAVEEIQLKDLLLLLLCLHHQNTRPERGNKRLCMCNARILNSLCVRYNKTRRSLLMMLLLPEQQQRGGQHQQQQQTPLLQLSSSISRRQNLKPSHLITRLLLPPANARVWRSYQAFTGWSNSSMPTSLDSNENFRSKSFSSSSWHIQYCTDCLLHSKCKWALSEARSSLSLLFLLGLL